jgi:hypothetical protein
VPNRHVHNGHLQQDEQDGAWMSPAYSVESNPSLLYTAAPHQLNMRMPRWENQMYDRMDPESARVLHNLEIGGPPSHVSTHETAPTADSEREIYTANDLTVALNSPQSRPVYGHPAQLAQAAMNHGYQVVAHHTQQEAAIAAQNNASRQGLIGMELELRNVRLCVDHILLERKMKDKEREKKEHRLVRKNRRIIRQVSRHLRELRWQMEVSNERLAKEIREAERLQYEFHAAQARLQAEADRAGLPDVAAVKAEAGEEFIQLLGHLLDDAPANN